MKRIAIAIIVVILSLNQANLNARSSGEIAASAQVIKITHGAHIKPTLNYGYEIAAFNNLVNKDIGVVMYFLDWSVSGQLGFYFDNYLVNRIKDVLGTNGPVVMLTWQPMNGKKPGCTKDYDRYMPLSEITGGNCDNYIRHFAQEIKVRPERFILRLGHEMNIQDTPWWPGHYNQDATAFIDMYRHVYDVFMAENVSNVEWAWSPNVGSYPVDAWNDRNNYYPGDEYVDWITFSGLNWNTPWYWFTDIFDSDIYSYALKDTACRYAKPQILAEFGSVEGFGASNSKASWITDAYSKIPQFPFLRGVIWHNDQGAVDFRVTTVTGSGTTINVNPLPAGTGAWTNAYKQAISNSVYDSTLPTIEQATPPTVYCGDGEPFFTVSPESANLSPGANSTHTFTAMLFDQSMTLSLKVPPGNNISGSFSPNSIQPPWFSSTLIINTSQSTSMGIQQVVIQGNGVDLFTINLNINNLHLSYIPLIIKH